MSIGKKNIILAIVLCVSLMVIGVSFAYFTSSIAITGTGSKVEGKTAELIKVSYDAGSTALNLENAVPGTSANKDFSVTVTPTDNENTVTYAIVLNISANTFEKFTSQTADNMCTVNANEVTYRLTDGTNELASGDLTEASGKVTLLKETKTASTETTYNYNLEITYVDTNADQNHNENKTFTSTLEVEFAEAN